MDRNDTPQSDRLPPDVVVPPAPEEDNVSDYDKDCDPATMGARELPRAEAQAEVIRLRAEVVRLNQRWEECGQANRDLKEILGRKDEYKQSESERLFKAESVIRELQAAVAKLRADNGSTSNRG